MSTKRNCFGATQKLSNCNANMGLLSPFSSFLGNKKKLKTKVLKGISSNKLIQKIILVIYLMCKYRILYITK